MTLIVANVRERTISASDRKSDNVDAEKLAHTPDRTLARSQFKKRIQGRSEASSVTTFEEAAVRVTQHLLRRTGHAVAFSTQSSSQISFWLGLIGPELLCSRLFNGVTGVPALAPAAMRRSLIAVS